MLRWSATVIKLFLLIICVCAIISIKVAYRLMGVPLEGLEQCPPFVDNHVHGFLDLGGHIRHMRPHWLGVAHCNLRIDKSS